MKCLVLFLSILWLNSFSLTEREYVGVKAGKEIQIFLSFSLIP